MPNQQMKEELEQLQLEEAREVARLRETRRLNKDSRRRAVEISLRRDRENQERIQAACWHRKGGKGVAQVYQGNDANYAVIVHTLSHGVTIVVCMRCGRTWRPPEKLPKKATVEQRAKYASDLAEYRRALNFPTDNEPSGATLFDIEKVEGEVTYA
jgi:hypothetical protein